jgi:hypothetical protein
MGSRQAAASAGWRRAAGGIGEGWRGRRRREQPHADRGGVGVAEAPSAGERVAEQSGASAKRC